MSRQCEWFWCESVLNFKNFNNVYNHNFKQASKMAPKPLDGIFDLILSGTGNVDCNLFMDNVSDIFGC